MALGVLAVVGVVFRVSLPLGLGVSAVLLTFLGVDSWRASSGRDRLYSIRVLVAAAVLLLMLLHHLWTGA